MRKYTLDNRLTSTRNLRRRLGTPEILEPRYTPSVAVASDSLRRLETAMDEYHRTYDVYTDIGAAGNHFHSYAKLGDKNLVDAVMVSGEWSDRPHRGATALRNKFDATFGADWGGLVHQNGVIPADLEFPVPDGTIIPLPNWGTYKDAGLDLSGVNRLMFWARGDQGGEQIDFYIGGVGRDPFSGERVAGYPDSSPRLPPHRFQVGKPCIDAARAVSSPVEVTTCVKLSARWQQFVITIPETRKMNYVLGGFAWVAEKLLNPNGAVFFLDDIQYSYHDSSAKQREPHLIRSFRTLDRQPSHPIPDDDFDFKLRNVAFTYDNALATLAFLADPDPNTRAPSLVRARQIGDAFTWAAKHDRAIDFKQAGRLRSAYTGGDYSLPPGWEPNGRKGVPPTPGWFDEQKGTFFEIEQRRFDVGNNAWAMIALLALYRRTNHSEYLEVARNLGEFIQRFKQPTEQFGGFTGGEEWPDGSTKESDPLVRLPWASTEHNLDVIAAFNVMFEVTKEMVWKSDAHHARLFVENMWDAVSGCYLTGTKLEGGRVVRNTDVLPLDAQTWSILAVPELLDRRLTSIDCIDTHHVTQHSGFTGVDFNSDKDGVWFEGTGQFAVALAMANPVDFRRVNVFRKELARAAGQVDADGIMGMVAATKDFLTTGFVLPSGQQFSYFRRLHIAAESWNVFAQVGFNPYYQTVIRTPGDATQDAVVSFSDFLVLAEEYGKTVDPTANTADFNGDLRVSFADFLILASNYGLGT